MADNIVEYQIAVTKSGTGAAEAASELGQLRTASGTTSASLKELRETSMLTREGTRILAEGAMFCGGSLGEFSKAGLMASESMRALRTAAMLSGVGFAELLIPLAALTTWVTPGVEGWKAYKAAIEETDSTTRLFAQTQSLAGTNIQTMITALAKGLVTVEDYNQITGLLGLGTDEGLRSAQGKMAALGISAEQIINYDKVKKLEQEMNDKTLGDFDQQRAKAQQVFNERMAQIDKLSFEQGLTANERGAAEGGARKEFNSSMDNIDKREQAKAYAEAEKQIENDLFYYEQSLAGKRELTADEEFNYRTDKMHALAVAGKISEADFTAYVTAEERKRVAGDIKAALDAETAIRQRAEAENKWANLSNKVTTENLTGEARKLATIKATTDAMIAEIQKVGEAAGKTQEEIDKMVADAKTGAQATQQASQDAAMGIMSNDQMIDRGIKEFASGMAQAMVDFADGTKSAQQAFGEFAAAFLKDMAKMIIEQQILNAIGHPGVGGVGGTGLMGLLGLATGGTVTADAFGGVHFAADGIQTVSSPTYFPKFNVLAGEQGTEMLTVLAKPTMRSLGGMDAVVGNAGSRRLAITNASDLEARGNGGGASGRIEINVNMHPDLKAEIINQSVQGARVDVVHQLKRNSPASQAVRQLAT